MLTLLYGTHAARDEIFKRIASDVKEERRAYLIVPDQKALLAEEALMGTLPKSAALLVDAVGFSRLSNLVCRRFGSLTYKYATSGAKALVMYRTHKKLAPYLKVFGGELQSGTLEALCTLMDELRACKVTAKALENAADGIETSPLCDKLYDLAMIYTDYEETLHRGFAEQADDIDTLCELLREQDFFGDAHIYIDSFVSFTKQESDVIERILARGSELCIALPFSRRGAHMAECSETRKKLLRIASDCGVTVNEIYTPSDAPAALEYAKEKLFDLSFCEPYLSDCENALALYECADKGEESELCLREIFLALERGESYSDIAIIARNAESYTGILDRTLSRCKIPYFFAKKDNAALMPLTRLILSALALYVYNFKESDVAAYIKTGLCGIDDDECDLFEEYINRWAICTRARYLDGEDFTMSPQGYITEDKSGTLDLVNEIKRRVTAPLARFCDTLDGAKTVRDFSLAVYEYLCDMGIREKSSDASFAKYFGTSKSAAAIRLWNITMDALDTMVDAAGDENVSAADFCTLVRLLFASIDISEIPTAKDMIIIGNADTIRIDGRRTVIILGAAEGVFPAPVAESPTLCENERSILKEAGVVLSQDMRQRSARELYNFVRAIDFASRRAVISYYRADEGGAVCEPSFAFARLKKLFPNEAVCSFGSLCAADRLFYAAQAAEKVGSFDGKTEALLCKTLTARGLYTKPLDSARLLQNGDARLSRDTARAIFGERMSLSQSRLDCYGDCHMNYFLRYMLSLEETSPFEFNPANTGTFLHTVLENFIAAVKNAGKKIGELTEEETELIATTLCLSEVERLMSTVSRATGARMLCFFDRMRRNVLLVAKNLVKQFKNSSFEPLLTEYKFGRGGHRPLEIKLSDGGTVSLCGIADRIDIFKEDGKVYVRIADYKSGDKKFSEGDLEKGKNLQLLIYLFSLCRVADKSFFDLVGVDSCEDILPGAAEYFVIKPPRVEINEGEGSAKGEELELGFSRMGFVFDSERLAHAIDSSAEKLFSSGLIEKDGGDTEKLFCTVTESIANAAEKMRSGDISAGETDMGYRSPCRYCAYVHVCRKENAGEEEAFDG